MSKMLFSLITIVLFLTDFCLNAETLKPSRPGLEELRSILSISKDNRKLTSADQLKELEARGQLGSASTSFYPETYLHQKLQDDNQDINKEQEERLRQALNRGEQLLVEQLVRAGVDSNIQDNMGRTALTYAVLTNNRQLLDELLARGANPNLFDNEGRTPLIYALLTDTVPMLKKLIKITNVNLQDRYGKTALMYAIEKRKPVIITYLLRMGADVNSRDKEGNTLLHYAVTTGNLALVKMLIQAGANLFAKNNAQQTPSQIAQKLGLSVILNELNTAATKQIHDKENKEFLRVLKSNDETEMENFVDRLTDVNQKDNEGKTYLIRAVQDNNYNMIDILIVAGADPRIPDKSGKTSFDYAHNQEVLNALDLGKTVRETNEKSLAPEFARAIINGNLQEVKELIRLGANVNLKPENLKYVPLILALFESNVPIIQALLAAGADPNIISGTEFPVRPLAYVAMVEGDKENLARLLLKAGAQVNVQDDKGNTPLSSAVREGNKNVVKLLLQAKADPNIPNNGGLPPLAGALVTSKLDIIKLLLDAGADPFFKPDPETSLYDIAVNEVGGAVARLFEDAARRIKSKHKS